MTTGRKTGGITAVGLTVLLGIMSVSRDLSRAAQEERTEPMKKPATNSKAALQQGNADKSGIVLVEAESMEDYGGWVLDQQFMDQMGSPYLLAHGLGESVKDAVTTVKIGAPGKYRLWVRTKDWVAAWRAPGAPGKFQVVINGQAAPIVFGTEGAEWHWQDGGAVELPSGAVKVALHDLTGFEGRCEAILLSADPNMVPPNGKKDLEDFRRRVLGLSEKPEEWGAFDLVVVGGGIPGICSAVSAARLGLTVALVQDRPVLGGNNSSEVRVWLNGGINLEPYPRIGDVVKELEPKKRAHAGEGNTAELYEDEKRTAMVKAEEKITLFPNYRVNAAEVKDSNIDAVLAQNIQSGKRIRLKGRWFVDCTGDGAVGFLAGAEHETTAKKHMGPSNLWNVKETAGPASFPRCPWALDLTDKPFPGRGGHFAQWSKPGLSSLGQWFWESGFDLDPVADVETMRDLNFRAMYGAWDALKNVDKVYPNHKLNWAAYIAGKRESRRLLGDVILSKEDLVSNRKFEDGCFPCTWGIDLHYPNASYQKGFEGMEFISRATSGAFPRPYWAPYRCLYSRNISNLFMAGRDISVTHEALGTARVMRTGGAMGEVVGMAASLCAKHNTTPRGIYKEHLNELKELMRKGVSRR